MKKSASKLKVSKASSSKRVTVKTAFLPKSAYSYRLLVIFLAVFAALGGYAVYKSFAASIYYLSPSGSDSNPCTQAAPCLSFDRAYQVATPGSKVQIASGTYGAQQINPKASMRNLSPGCTLDDTTNCVTFEPVGTITLNGKLEVRGSSVYIKGTRSTSTPDANATFTINANGYADVEADSNSTYPDHVILQGINTNSFGAFNVNTATFKDMDVGPGTVVAPNGNCYVKEGNGMENKIGWGGDVSYVPRDITVDSVRIHNQNGDKSRENGDGGSGCHWGGLFLVTVDGLTVKNSVFERNVVYHVQIQNFGGAPPAKRVVFDSNSFGCPVEWQYLGDICDGQNSIQFDYDPGTEFRISNNAESNGSGKIYACYVGSCGGLSGVNAYGNTSSAASTTAPPLPGGSNPPPPPPPPPTVSISANPTAITSGGSSTMSWSSTNASSCSASNAWSGTKAVSGSQAVSPTTTSTYTLTCSGSGGSANNSVTVTVGSSGNDTTPPSAPSNLRVTSKTTNSVSVAWDAATDNVGVTGYRLYNGQSSVGTVTGLSYTFGGLTCGTQYSSLGVQTFDAAGNTSNLAEAIIVPVTTNACASKPGDLNSDNQVNILDLSILLTNYNTSNSNSDINKDGTVNIIDLSVLLSNYGT